jgi:hypothetical protein
MEERGMFGMTKEGSAKGAADDRELRIQFMTPSLLWRRARQ